MGNNERNIIRIIDREEAQTYHVQLDRKRLAQIKEKIAQRCSIIETSIKDNKMYDHGREEIYTFPQIYDDIGRLEKGNTSVLKTMWQDEDLELPVPHDIKREIEQWQDSYQGPKGNRFLVLLSKQIAKLEAENRRIEKLLLPQESCRRYFSQIESCLQFQLIKTQDVHELSSALRTLSSDFSETLEPYAQSFYSPTPVIQLVKRNQVKSSVLS